jgi:hypothetical protein
MHVCMLVCGCQSRSKSVCSSDRLGCGHRRPFEQLSVCSQFLADAIDDMITQARGPSLTCKGESILMQTLELLKHGTLTHSDLASFSALAQPLESLRSKAHAALKAAVEAGVDLPVYAILRESLKELVNRCPRPTAMWPRSSSLTQH